MNKLGQFLSTVVIGGFAVVVIAMIAVSGMRGPVSVQNSLLAALDNIEHSGLSATAIAPADLYGDDWVAAAIVCPGQSAKDVDAMFGADITGLDEQLKSPVDAEHNYLVVANNKQEAYAEKLPIAKVNLCAAPVGGAFQSTMMIPLIQDPQGGWTLVA